MERVHWIFKRGLRPDVEGPHNICAGVCRSPKILRTTSATYGTWKQEGFAVGHRLHLILYKDARVISAYSE